MKTPNSNNSKRACTDKTTNIVQETDTVQLTRGVAVRKMDCNVKTTKRTTSPDMPVCSIKFCLSRMGFLEWSSMFLAVVISAYLIAGLSLRGYIDLHSLKRYRLTAGDEVAISKMTEDYEVTVEGQRGVVYLLDASKSLKRGLRSDKPFMLGGLSGQSQYSFKALYLQEGSMISASACQSQSSDIETAFARTVDDQCESHAYFLAIKSHKAFNKWLEVLKTNTVPHTHSMTSFCFSGINHCNERGIHITIEDSDTYYLVLAKEGMQNFTGQVDISVDREYYSIESMIDACYYDTSCILSLPYSTRVEIVVLLRDNLEHPDGAAYISTHCKSRIVFWLAVFMAPPLVITIGCLLICCSGCIYQRLNQLRQKKLETTTALTKLKNVSTAVSKSVRVSLDPAKFKNKVHV